MRAVPLHLLLHPVMQVVDVLLLVVAVRHAALVGDDEARRSPPRSASAPPRSPRPSRRCPRGLMHVAVVAVEDAVAVEEGRRPMHEGRQQLLRPREVGRECRYR